MTKNRARIMILSELLAFPTIHGKDWYSDYDVKPQVGDLVSMHSAAPSKWYLSWVREINLNNGWPKYLLESIDDESLCWWENIGLTVYDRQRLKERHSWQWTDKQFQLSDRWRRVRKRRDEYIVVGVPPTFGENGAVTFDVRVRFSLGDYHNPRTFPNWKKVTIKMMDDYYVECLQGHELSRKGPTNESRVT